MLFTFWTTGAWSANNSSGQTINFKVNMISLEHMSIVFEEMIACEQALCLGKGWKNFKEREEKQTVCLGKGWKNHKERGKNTLSLPSPRDFFTLSLNRQPVHRLRKLSFGEYVEVFEISTNPTCIVEILVEEALCSWLTESEHVSVYRTKMVDFFRTHEENIITSSINFAAVYACTKINTPYIF